MGLQDVYDHHEQFQNASESQNLNKFYKILHQNYFAALFHQRTFDPEFQNISETDADTIETFLDARAAANASFDWTPPGESSASKFICLSWSKTIPYNNRASISASFQEVAEP